MRLPQRQNGQMIVLIAIILPVLLGMGALAVDVAHLFVEKRHTQNAVDAASLAAAAQLPFPAAACGGAYNVVGTCQYNVSQAVQTYSNYNGGPNVPFPPCSGASDTNCYVTPYVTSSDPTGQSHVQVRIQQSAPTWFIGALGIGGPVNVSSSAAASPQTQTTPGSPGTVYNTNYNTSTSYTTNTVTTYANDAAMFAMNPVCGSNNGIVIGNAGGGGGGGGGSSGNFTQVVGPSISNGSVNIFGNPQTHMSYVSYRSTSAGNCSAGPGVPAKVGTTTTHSNTFVAPQDWPKSFDDAAICNNYVVDPTNPNLHIVTGTYSIPLGPPNPTGIWCNKLGSISFPNTNGNVTIVANQVTINGNNDSISAYTQGLLAYMTGTGTLDVEANGSSNASLTGYLFAPNGDIAYNGNSGANGFYEAQNIRVFGNSFTITGNGPGGTPGTTTTVTTNYTTSSTVSSTVTTGPPTTSVTGMGLDQ